MLTALGANSSVALAADMIWRVTTYFPPIFVGLLTYLIWKRGMAKGITSTTPTSNPHLRWRPRPAQAEGVRAGCRPARINSRHFLSDEAQILSFT